MARGKKSREQLNNPALRVDVEPEVFDAEEDLQKWKRASEQIFEQIKKEPSGIPSLDLLNDLQSVAIYSLLNGEPQDTKEFALGLNKYIKQWLIRLAQEGDEDALNQYWTSLKWESRYLFDTFMLYIERNREPENRFYQPRRKQLLKTGIIQAFQDMEDGKLDVLTISMPPGTGKTSLSQFFLAWVIGRHPEMYNLFYTHTEPIEDLEYRAIMEITQSNEYDYAGAFPDVVMTEKNAKLHQINFNNPKLFRNLQTGTIKSSLAGRVRANGYLICDDLIGKMERALNNAYLDKLWTQCYVGDAKQRKMDECKEIHIATRWSVRDVVGRVIQEESSNPRFRELTVDCYDENGESQFDYDFGVGLSTKFLHNQEKYYDDISFRCLYRNQPIEREGLLYNTDELRRFSELPTREPDAIIGVCDTKEKGTDYMVMPVVYQYDDDYYVVDCICDNHTDFARQYDRLSRKILNHNMQTVQFESNQGGLRVAYEIEKRVQEAGGRCVITTKHTETNKETKIIVNSEWVKQHMLFKEEDMYVSKSDYGRFMSQLCSYSTVGRNPCDDTPDAVAMFALFVNGGVKKNKAYAVKNPFKRGSYQ